LRAGEGAVRGYFQAAKIGARLRLGGWAEDFDGAAESLAGRENCGENSSSGAGILGQGRI
ncbi:hypothetical protein, partial [Campylobacter sp.]|uniref:hypothetical protein n=1 Tax=Campylobacter sp. TaxID=205 RepID=UPI0026DDA55D